MTEFLKHLIDGAMSINRPWTTQVIYFLFTSDVKSVTFVFVISLLNEYLI